jgi:uncharacterized membrane protein YoaK (UPF0700 family)
MTSDKILPYALLGMTSVTGLVDAISFLSLGHVFTANMTGNIVILGFATAGVAELSKARSLTGLSAFLVGAILGGRIMARENAESQVRLAIVAFGLEVFFLLAASLCAIGYSVSSTPRLVQVYGLITLTALAMGIRNASVRKLAVADLTTTVLTLTIAGLAADSFFAGGSNPRWQRRIAAILAMFAGAAIGAMIVKHSVFAALALAAVANSVCSVALLFSLRRDAQVHALSATP